MAAGAFTLPKPPTRRRTAFALTPLADVMFQLLIFFMLSTSLAPYSLLPLGAPKSSDQAPQSAQRTEGGRPVIWHVSVGGVRSGGRLIQLEDLIGEIAALKARGLSELVLFTTPEATAQDLASVMEAVRVGEVARLRLIARAGQ